MQDTNRIAACVIDRSGGCRTDEESTWQLLLRCSISCIHAVVCGRDNGQKRHDFRVKYLSNSGAITCKLCLELMRFEYTVIKPALISASLALIKACPLQARQSARLEVLYISYQSKECLPTTHYNSHAVHLKSSRRV